MLLRIQIPKSVYLRLKKGEDIKAITSFNRDNKEQAYRIISELSGFDNFWFAMVVDDADEEDLEYNCKMHSSEEAVNLLIDVPESECYVTNFYDFSDLIYFTAEEPNQKQVDAIIKSFKSGRTSGMQQAIFPVLRSSYIVKKL